MKVDRRRLIGALAGLGALGALGLAGRCRPGGGEGLALSAAERSTLLGALEALLPDPGRAPALLEAIDAALVEEDPLLVDQLGLALAALEQGHLGWRAFSALELEARVERLADWEGSDLVWRRAVFQALRRLAMFACFADPGAWEELGYPGPWVRR
jgi:hypothetical protein